MTNPLFKKIKKEVNKELYNLNLKIEELTKENEELTKSNDALKIEIRKCKARKLFILFKSESGEEERLYINERLYQLIRGEMNRISFISTQISWLDIKSKGSDKKLIDYIHVKLVNGCFRFYLDENLAKAFDIPTHLCSYEIKSIGEAFEITKNE